MGKRGPTPTPSETLKRQGRYRPDRRKCEPEAPAANARKPAWIKGLAAKHWKQIAPLLIDAKLLTVLDTVALGLLCDALAEYLEAGEIVEAAAKDGVKFIATTDKGNVIQHPAVGVRNKAWERVVKLARQFGMTPSARAGMAIANAADEQRDPLLTLLHERMSRN
ncbi:MAG: phage terminase small subunit P27 family [Pirellulaceae bacterium]|jgi:P27 family predicted phage terminase small subunit|nr:phage terminase small subunit P27 family [Pirellulaceae bacterium]